MRNIIYDITSLGTFVRSPFSRLFEADPIALYWSVLLSLL